MVLGSATGVKVSGEQLTLGQCSRGKSGRHHYPEADPQASLLSLGQPFSSMWQLHHHWWHFIHPIDRKVHSVDH